MSLESLPDDIIHLIFPLLEVEDILALERTNWRMRALIDSNHHWCQRARASPHKWLLDGSASDKEWPRRVAMALESGSRVVQTGRPMLFPSGLPQFTKIVEMYASGHLLALARDGGLWALDVSNRPRVAEQRVQHIKLPFAVADIAADREYATVLTTGGEVWDIGPCLFPQTSGTVEFDTWLKYRYPPKDGAGVDTAQGQDRGQPAPEQGAQEQGVGKKRPPRVLQVLALPTGGWVRNEFLGGCVTDDGCVHVWNRLGTVPHHSHMAMCGPYIAGWTHKTVASSEALPGLRSAALYECGVVALTEDGGVWHIGVRVWEGDRSHPILASNAFSSWEKIESLSFAGASLLALDPEIELLAVGGGSTVRVAIPSNVDDVWAGLPAYEFSLPGPVSELAATWDTLDANVGGRVYSLDMRMPPHHPLEESGFEEGQNPYRLPMPKAVDFPLNPVVFGMARLAANDLFALGFPPLGPEPRTSKTSKTSQMNEAPDSSREPPQQP